MSVLVVDDDPAFRKLVEMVLGDELGVPVVGVSDGEAGLLAARACRPDLPGPARSRTPRSRPRDRPARRAADTQVTRRPDRPAAMVVVVRGGSAVHMESGGVFEREGSDEWRIALASLAAAFE